MSFGETLGAHILTEVIVKAVEIGYHVVRQSGLYINESEETHLRFKMQVSILDSMNKMMSDGSIQQRLRKVDVTTYTEVMVHLLKLFRKYVKRHCKPGEEKIRLLNSTSVEQLLKRWEDEKALEKLTERKAVGWRFLSRTKEEAAWIVWGRQQDEKLISEIEFWGAKLDQFSSWIIPGMFSHATPRDIVRHLGDRRMEAVRLKGQIMTARLDASAIESESSRMIAFQQIKFLGTGYLSPSSAKISRNTQSELGGADRRQWATYTDEKGLTHRVIVEFKPPVCTEDGASSIYVDKTKENLNILVQTLRLAGQKSNAFHVLYCYGWYVTYDHFGLVYRLPSIRTTLLCQTLSNILLSREYRSVLAENLENRLRLSKALAWTMLELHSADWVHRALTANNILIFGEQKDQRVKFDWDSPYIAGFDSSRSDSGISDEQNHGKKEFSIRVYTHPDRQTQEYIRYQKVHDIYSLGVILLELGRLQSFLEPDLVYKLEHLSPHKMREMFIQKAQQLKAVMGERFAKVVINCLTGRFMENVSQEDDYVLLSSFHDEICEPLADIQFCMCAD